MKRERAVEESNDFGNKRSKLEEEVNNDEFSGSFFEEASKAWRLNKIERNDCTYEYKCIYCDPKSGKRCNRVLYEYELRLYKKEMKPNADIFCKTHIYKPLMNKNRSEE
jgi:hypothetical protein